MKELNIRSSTKRMTRYFILAATLNGVIGKDNQLPWNLPEEYQYFLDRVKNADAIITARETYRSIGDQPLTPCPHYLRTRSADLASPHPVIVFSDLDQIPHRPGQNIWYIGGRSIYEAIDEIRPDVVYLTTVGLDIPIDHDTVTLSDSFFQSLHRDYAPSLLRTSVIVDQDRGVPVECRFERWDRVC